MPAARAGTDRGDAHIVVLRYGARATGAFRAMAATTWTGIGKRAVEGDLICLFFIGLHWGAAKPV